MICGGAAGGVQLGSKRVNAVILRWGHGVGIPMNSVLEGRWTGIEPATCGWGEGQHDARHMLRSSSDADLRINRGLVHC